MGDGGSISFLTALQPESLPMWLLLLINTPYNNYSTPYKDYAFHKQLGFESCVVNPASLCKQVALFTKITTSVNNNNSNK